MSVSMFGSHVWELDWSFEAYLLASKKMGFCVVYNMFPIFCPATPKGALASSWRKIATEIVEQSKGQVKPRIVEQGGVPIRAIICKKSPAETNECRKMDCPVCISGKSKMKNCLKVTPGGARIRYQMHGM